MKIAKGELTRLNIIDRSREIFNLLGISITIDTVARELGISKSRITNHFSAKDHLFLAIMAEYEHELSDIIKKWYPVGVEKSLQVYLNMLSEVMDIQLKYRCAIIYLNLLSPSQHELKKETNLNFERNKDTIKNRLIGMQKEGLVKSDLLEPSNWDAFLFVYVNLLTQWVVYLNLYEDANTYKERKQIYLKGIMNHLYLPYLTNKGKNQLEKLVYY